MAANLSGTIAGVNKSTTGVEVTVEFKDELGGITVLNVPMQLEKAKTLGIGTEVEIFLKKKRKPRVRAAAAANGTAPIADQPVANARGRRRVPAAATAE